MVGYQQARIEESIVPKADYVGFQINESPASPATRPDHFAKLSAELNREVARLTQELIEADRQAENEVSERKQRESDERWLLDMEYRRREIDLRHSRKEHL